MKRKQQRKVIESTGAVNLESVAKRQFVMIEDEKAVIKSADEFVSLATREAAAILAKHRLLPGDRVCFYKHAIIGKVLCHVAEIVNRIDEEDGKFKTMARMTGVLYNKSQVE